MIESYLQRAQAIIVLPQCRPGKYWSDAEMSRMTLGALEAAITEFDGDAKRTYLVGVSMGGYGAWGLAAENPKRFAAIVSICGGSPVREGDRFYAIANRIGHTPVCVFHGSDDRVVPVSESRNMVQALCNRNADVQYSEFKGVGHNVWFNALAEPELLPWLFKQRISV